MARSCSNTTFRLLQSLVGHRKRNGTHSMRPFLVDLSAPFLLLPSVTPRNPITTKSPVTTFSPTGRPGSFTQATPQAPRQSRPVHRYTRTELASMAILTPERRAALSALCLLTLSTQQTRATFKRLLHSQTSTISGLSSRILDIVVLRGKVQSKCSDLTCQPGCSG